MKHSYNYILKGYAVKKIMFSLLMLLGFQAVNAGLASGKFNAQLGTSKDSSEHLSKRALHLTNDFRESKGLVRITWNENIAKIAQDHATRMGKGLAPFSHDGFAERVNKIPGKIAASAENIYRGNRRGDIAQLAVSSWIGSKGHLKNIMGKYNQCGIGMYKNADGFWYVTQLFARS